MRACARVALASIAVSASFSLSGCAAIEELKETFLRWVESEKLPSGRGVSVSAIDRRTTRHQGYGISQSCRAMTECIFGWGKQHGTMRKTKHRGIASVAADFLLNLIAYNLIRIPKLLAA